MLSSCNFESEDSEQLCLLSCNFCSILLAVSVPRSSLCEMVTIRCGYCANMWSINIGASTLQSMGQDFQFPSSTLPELRIDSSSSSKHKKRATRPPATEVIKERVVNQPPKKRHRAPSAYNQFIKEEIQRIKANNMKITHREAFSTAAKNEYGCHEAAH